MDKHWDKEYRNGGSISSDRRFTEWDFNKLMASDKFRAVWSGNLWEIIEEGRTRVLGKFNPKTKSLYISGDKNMNNFLVVWMTENGFVNSDEYAILANGGGIEGSRYANGGGLGEKDLFKPLSSEKKEARKKLKENIIKALFIDKKSIVTEVTFKYQSEYSVANTNKQDIRNMVFEINESKKYNPINIYTNSYGVLSLKIGDRYANGGGIGNDWFWNHAYRHYMRDASLEQRNKVKKQFIKEGLELDGESPRHFAIISSIVGEYANGGGVEIIDKDELINLIKTKHKMPINISDLYDKVIEKYMQDHNVSRSDAMKVIPINSLTEQKVFFANGGGVERIDLFEDYENIPTNIQEILDEYSQDFEDGNYDGLAKALEEVESQGYTFEYYLDGQAYGLRPIGVPLNQLKGYEDMGEEYAGGGAVGRNLADKIIKKLEDKGYFNGDNLKLTEKFNGKEINLNFYFETESGDWNADIGASLEQIQIISKYLDFDRVDGLYEISGDAVLDWKLYKGNNLVCSIGGYWDAVEEYQPTVIKIGDIESSVFNFYPLDGMGGLDIYQFEKNLKNALNEIKQKNLYSAVVSLEGYEQYSEKVDGLENAKQAIQDIKENTRFQVVKGDVASGDLIKQDEVIENYANGGAIKTDFNELENTELRNVLISFWNDFFNSNIGNYLSIEKENYILSNIDNVFVIVRDEDKGNFSNVEKQNIDRFLSPYFDSVFTDFFNNYEIKDNKIIIYMKAEKMYANGGGVDSYPFNLTILVSNKDYAKIVIQKHNCVILNESQKDKGYEFALGSYDWRVLDKIADELYDKGFFISQYANGGGVSEKDLSSYSNDALNDMIINLSRFENTEDMIQAVKYELKNRSHGNSRYAKTDYSDLAFASKTFSKTSEMLVRENLNNGEICMCKLTKILGHEPNYPIQIVGSLKLEKCFMKRFYRIV